MEELKMKNVINRQNKEEMGMNRNEFYEYKKDRIIELVKNNASTEDIAMDLGLDLKGLYAFVSRNFGGFRQLRSLAKSGKNVPQLKVAAMSIDNSTVKENQSKNNNVMGNKKNSSIMSMFDSALTAEKERILRDFRTSVDVEAKKIIVEAQQILDKSKFDLLNAFKNDIMKEKSGFSK